MRSMPRLRPTCSTWSGAGPAIGCYPEWSPERALGHYTHEKNPVACAAGLATIECSVVGTLYTGKQTNSESYLTDIAILHSGSYTAGDYLPVSSEPPNPGTTVNVIGYPGPAKEQWLAIHEGLQNVEASRLVTDQMFPPRRLTISSGTVEALGGNIAYRVSTMPGMSGAPVLCNGSAIG